MDERDELLELAKSYYVVADDLRQQSQDMARTAKQLSATADRLCEEHMRRNQKPVAAPVSTSAGCADDNGSKS